ncbi:VacJ family lipoprotein [Paucibacter sp. B2R-40]|uniref:MlaA family lipoprotein n=1 Tax=Paucibacter sp. B2R-40 TaxID=2893554 RepID=UPI0021E4AE4B|nr:VacJ family lipoprotein [Paucibacter sp. B2R-40]MCV2356205.1 VacJ family lipoprotein [Paucibacter sp. B2R-40]
MNVGRPRSLLTRSLLLGLVLFLSACASMRSAPGSAGQKLDPWEPWNRKVFAFNESLDTNFLKPVATVYSNIVPGPIRQSVDNFVNNVADAWTTVNLVLQWRLKASVEQGMRFAVNSTLGFGGLIDIASEVGLERKNEDMGKTFGRWGTGTGAYIVWPLLGPSSVRDTLAMPFDWQASPAFIFRDGTSKLAIYSLQTINTRSNFLRASEMLEGIALDRYTFYRDAFLQRRGNIGDDDEFEVLVPAVKDESNPQAGP